MDRPEDRRHTRTEEYYPHPSRDQDPAEARRRVQANPAVMPPSTPRYRRSWANREVLGMRALPLVILVSLGIAIPLLGSLLGRWRSGKRPTAMRRAHEKVTGREVKAPASWKKAARRKGALAWEKAVRTGRLPAKIQLPGGGYPRFVVLASRPHGRGGKRARARMLGKVEPAT